MKLLKDIVLRLLVLPLMVFSLLIALAVRAMWGASMWWERGVLVVRLSPTSWPNNVQKKWGGWYARWGGTCFGHGIIMNHGSSAAVLDHEMKHTEQHEAHSIAGLVFALPLLVVSPWVSVLVWTFMPVIAYVAGMIVALLRDEDPYRGNHLEEAAYDSVEHKD